MDIHHPWTKYEVARLRDEERLLRARSAMRAVELRAEVDEAAPQQAGSFLDRIRRRQLVTGRASAGTRAG